MTLRNSLSVAGSQGGPPTILSHDDSTIDEKVFDIDDEIVNSATYRRALHHNASKRNMGDKLPPQPRSSNVEIHVGSDDGRDDFTPTPSPTPSKEARPLPYENSVFSEPVDVYSPGKHAYIPLSSRSDVAPERDRPLAHRFRSSELGKRTFWSSLTPKRSSRQVNSPTVTASSPNTSSSSLVPGFQRGRRGFENSSHASIDFGSESGLSAPSIVRAAQAGSVMEVEMLLNQDCDVDAAHQQSGRTALAVASQYVLTNYLYLCRLSVLRGGFNLGPYKSNDCTFVLFSRKMLICIVHLAVVISELSNYFCNMVQMLIRAMHPRSPLSIWQP